jgi:hypothetical protein
VPGRVDQVDAMIVPEAGRGGRGDRDPPLLLLLHPVHRRGALVDLAELVDLLRVEEDPLGHCRLAGVDVRDDPDVPGALERDVRARRDRLGWRCCVVIGLPLEVAEGAVRLGHAVGILAALDLPRRCRCSRRCSSAASLSLMLLPFRLRADSISQRMPRLTRRSARTSTGIWYVEPPTRFGLTSMSGIALRRACSEHLDAGAAGLLTRSVTGTLEDAVREVSLAAVHELVRELVERQRRAGQLLGVLRLARDRRTSGHCV